MQPLAFGPPLRHTCVTQATYTYMHDSTDFCASVVVVNLCSAPTRFTLGLKGLLTAITSARHIVTSNYVVGLNNNELSDTIAGYSSAVLSLGSKEWNEDLARASGHPPPCCGMGCGCT